MKVPVVFGAALKVVVPPLLGAAGALAATMAPSYYAMVCGGSGLLGGL